MAHLSRAIWRIPRARNPPYTSSHQPNSIDATQEGACPMKILTLSLVAVMLALSPVAPVTAK